MNTIDLGKIGITLGGEWVSAATYEYLTMVTRHGISYVSKRTTTNEDPELVSAAWQPCSLRGESLYELMVDTGRFVGTLDEFLDEYEDTLQDAQDAANAANESNREFTEAEGLRVTAENGRVLAENNRVDQETYRQTTFAGYNARIESIENSEATRQSNEITRQLNEGTRQTNETARVNAEGTVEGHTGRAYAESQRVANENARIAAEGTVQSQTGRAYAESLRVTAENDRVAAENQRQLNEGSATDAPSATGSRWARYKYAESQRNDSYNTEEGSSSSTAGDGSRWGSYKTAEAQRSTDVEMLKETKANIDGYYSTLTAGAAENLVGQTIDSEAYLIRPTGGQSNEVANGVASVLGMEGTSCVWNQLVPNNTTRLITGTIASEGEYVGNTLNWSAISGHKYLFIVSYYSNNVDGITQYQLVPSGGWSDGGAAGTPVAQKDVILRYLFTAPSSGNLSCAFRVTGNVGTVVNTTVSKINIIDVSLIGIDTTTTSVLSWITQHVGLKPDYAYNTGTILSAQTLGIKTYGQNLLNPTTRQAKLIPYEWEENSNVYTIKNVPAGATATFTPDKTGVAETVDISGGSLDITSYGSGILELSAATANTYVCMKWDEQKDDDVVPFEEHTQNFDVRKVYGKVNGAGEYVQCFPNGMRSAGSVHDILTASEASDGTKKVDLGTLTWTLDSGRFWATLPEQAVYRGTGSSNNSNVIISNSKYILGSIFNIADKINNRYAVDMETSSSAGGMRIYIIDNSYSSSSDFKTAISGTQICYETHYIKTYTDLIYRDGGIDRPLADVLMNITVNNWSIEEQLLTPYVDGNPTAIPAKISTIYGMDAVEQIDTLQKNCYFAADIKANMQALLSCINTNCSETLGGTFSISETATDKVFDFTFTPNTEPEP